MFAHPRISASFVLLVTLLLASSLPAFHTVLPTRAQSVEPPAHNYLASLAATTGADPSQLQLVDQSRVTLPDGREVARVKAINRTTGRVVGATFDGQTMVDEAALRTQVAAQWRAAHGALVFDLARKLDALKPNDTLDVALWLKASIQPLEKAERINSTEKTPDALAGPTTPGATSPGVGNDDKPVEGPLSADQVPAAVLAALAGSDAGQGPVTSAVEQPATQPGLLDKVVTEPGLATAPVEPETVAALAQVEAFKAQNDMAIAAQVAPLRAHILDVLAARGLAGHVTYASASAPVVYLSGVSRQDVAGLAFLSEVDAIYDASIAGGPALSNARPTQNGDLVETYGGYTGSGVSVAVVEGERMVDNNPYLAVTAVRDATRSVQPHPSAVGGVIRSTYPSLRGLAPGIDLYNSNGDDYATAGAMATAMDWGSASATVLNNSFWIDDMGTTDAPSVFDRQMDYIARYNYDTAVVAAGNYASAECSGGPQSYVTTPGKGYNVLTVGNYDDANTLSWSDDAMDPCSSYNHFDRWKPEVAAVGHDLQSTTTASPWTGSVGSGTSYAAPMVSALAADLIQADPSLGEYPEALRAIIMATAEHNVEGDARLSRPDGAGGIDASAAAVLVERGNWDDRIINSNTTFPIVFSVYAWQGERVRFVTNWLSNPASDYSTDPQPIDIDVQAFREDGTTSIDSSTDVVTNFEILDFVAPASEYYQIKLTVFAGSLSDNTRLASAWWRGPWRSAPDTGFIDSKARPMGVHFAYYPADHPGVHNWRAMGIRSSPGTDHDLELTTASYFADPSTRSQVNFSNLSGSLDFIAVDGNHWLSTPEFYHVYNFSGSDGFNSEYSSPGRALVGSGWYGPFSMEPAETVKVSDVYFTAGQTRHIWVVPTESNQGDLGVALLQSDPADATTWTRRHTQRVVEADASTMPRTAERFTYANTAAADWLGLVVYNNTATTASFYILVMDQVDQVYLPLMRKQ